MNDEVKKIIGESYKRLPFDLKKAIVSGETRQQVQAIADRHHLLYEQVADLETETALVMLGLRPQADFITNVKGALNLPEEKARAIAEDINTEIFRPVRESLKKIHGITSDQQPTTSNPQPITQTTPVIPAIPKPPTPVVPKPPIPPPPKQELASIPARPSGGAAPASLAFQKKELPPPEDETKLNREDILRDIENPVPTLARPASLAAKASLASRKDEKPPKPSYQADPYREPLR